MVARIPALSLPSAKPATGILLFCSVISSLFRASIPPVKRTSMVFRATPVAASGTVFLDHLADGATGEPVGGGELLVVGPGYGRLGVAAVVEELLPLADHPQVSIVQNGNLYVQPEVSYRGELLDVHLDAAVAGYDPNGVFGIGESHAHRRWQREAHRAEAAARDVAVGLGELEELGSPHLVLPHVRDEPQVGACRGLYGLHHLY